jgi:dCMP deaminase
MKEKWTKYYLKIAEETSKLSTAKRLKVGCVIVKDNRILSIGYNGMPSGWTNDCEETIDTGTNVYYDTKPEVLHAEANALMKLCQSTESSKDAWLFVTHCPCLECAKLIYQAGIKNVFYINEYRSEQGLEFLSKAGVEVCKVK